MLPAKAGTSTARTAVMSNGSPSWRGDTLWNAVMASLKFCSGKETGGRRGGGGQRRRRQRQGGAGVAQWRQGGGGITVVMQETCVHWPGAAHGSPTLALNAVVNSRLLGLAACPAAVL